MTRTIFVTGSDTGIGKTRVTAALARLLAGAGGRVQIVKAVETGRVAGESGDADQARAMAGAEKVDAFTLATFAAPLAPLAAAALEGREFSLETMTTALKSMPSCDWRIVEGAGGIAVPVDADGRDWADFAAAIGAEKIVLVVADRLGAINQARLAHAYATQRGLDAGVWLNAPAPVEPAVAASNRSGLQASDIPLWATLGPHQISPEKVDAFLGELLAVKGRAGPLGPPRIFEGNASQTGAPGGWVLPAETRRDAASTFKASTSDENSMPSATAQDVSALCRESLAERERRGLRRRLRVFSDADGVLNLADNDYLALARDPAVADAVAQAAREHGTSASASPLITGWRPAHEALLDELCRWHGLPCGLLWTSGYAANAGILGVLPQRGDVVLADRLIHHSMIAGLLRSEARFQRYRHLDLDQLERMLEAADGRTVFVVTESVFSMDGDYPDLARMAALKRRHRFFWIVDEAHGLGWYGAEGAGLASEAGVAGEVDILVGTLGKTLASGGAYALFRDEAVRDQVMNQAGEFIYSTAMPTPAAAGALAAVRRVRELSAERTAWQASSRRFRERLIEAGWDAARGESPVVPVKIGEAARVVALAEALRVAGIFAGAVRPPTVPEGTSRLRFSLKRTFGEVDASRVLAAMDAWRRGA